MEDNKVIHCFISADQQEALRQFREKEDEWERMRKRLEKQVTKLSESIASSRRNSLTPWGMSLLSWLNLDSDHASGQDDNDYEEGSRDGNNDDYVLSEENDDNDGGYGTTNGVVNTDSSDVMVLRSGSSVPVERGGGDADVDAGWSRDHPMSRLRSRSRFRSRDERQSRSEAHDRSPLLPRDRSQSRSPSRPMWETTSSGRRRFSRSRHARPLSRHLSRTRPDLTAIPDVPVESNNDRRSRLRGSYSWHDPWHDAGSGRSSASESNWSYRDEDVFLSDTYYSDHSSPYYTHGSHGDGDYEDFPDEDVSQHESLSPVGVDTEEDTRTVVSISESHISAEFSQQEDSDGEAARSPGDAPVSESVSDDHVSTGSHGTVDSQSAFDDSNGNADNADDGGHIFDDITGGSSDGSRCVDDGNDIGHSDELQERYLQSGVHTNTGSPPDDYTDLVDLSSYTYHDREPIAADTRSGPATEHSTGSSGDLRETLGEGRPDFNNIIRDSDIMVSAEETVGGDHDAGQNKASSTLVDGVGSSRKRRRHDGESDGGFASSRKKLKWHEPADPWAAQDRWPADGVYDYYTRDYVNGTASSGSFRFNRTDSRPSTVTSSAGSRAVGDVQVSSHPRRRHRHPIRRHTSVGRMSTLPSSSQPPAEARDRVTSQSGSANEGITTDVHRRTATRAPRHAAPVSVAARSDASDGVNRRRHTIENTDVAATTRSGRRSSRRHRNLHDGRHDSRGGDQLVARPPVDILEASDSDDTLWQPDGGGDGGHSSDHSQSTEEPTSDSSYEVLVPKTWVQMLNEYDSQDSDHSWRP